VIFCFRLYGSPTRIDKDVASYLTAISQLHVIKHHVLYRSASQHEYTVAVRQRERRDSATGYGLDDRGVALGFPVGERFSPLRLVQTGSVALPASYPMDTGGFSLGVKRPGHKAVHWPPTSVEVKKTWIYTSTPPYIFVAWWLFLPLRGDGAAVDHLKAYLSWKNNEK
jgi:hypothetical protein